VSANDIWAVGLIYQGTIARTLIEHWNGTAWSIVPSPNVGTESTYLFKVSAVSANDVWAIGTHNGRSLALHWDGTQWIEVERDWGVAPDFLTTVAAVSSTNVWATGYNYTDGVFFIHYSNPCAAPAVANP
jgi:hypothetical protein